MSKKFRYRKDGLGVGSYYGPFRTGYVRYIDKGDGTVLLGDIFVYSEVVVKHGWLARLIRLCNPDWGIVRPRQLGIGTELLKRFLRACDESGIWEIYGNVTPDADTDQPFLKRWYERAGFHIAAPDGRDETIPVAYKVIRQNSLSQSDRR